MNIIWVFPKITPKWMVYKGKLYENGWFAGAPIFGNTHIIYIYYLYLICVTFWKCWKFEIEINDEPTAGISPASGLFQRSNHLYCLAFRIHKSSCGFYLRRNIHKDLIENWSSFPLSFLRFVKDWIGPGWLVDGSVYRKSRSTLVTRVLLDALMCYAGYARRKGFDTSCTETSRKLANCCAPGNMDSFLGIDLVHWSCYKMLQTVEMTWKPGCPWTTGVCRQVAKQ